jgi:hypothetical protein
MGELSKATGGEAKTREGLKSRERATEKTELKRNGDYSRITDILAGSLIFDNETTLKKAFDKLKNDRRVISIKDRWNKPTEDGYRDYKLNVRLSNGHIAEVQLLHQGIEQAKSSLGHYVYEFARRQEDDSAFIKKAEEISRAIYDAGLNGTLQTMDASRMASASDIARRLAKNSPADSPGTLLNDLSGIIVNTTPLSSTAKGTSSPSSKNLNATQNTSSRDADNIPQANKTRNFNFGDKKQVQKSADRVRDDVAKQLAGINVPKAQARAAGDIVSSAMTTFARREGLSPEEFYKRLELDFTREHLDTRRGQIDLTNLIKGIQGKNTVTFSDDSDAATLLHEHGHLFRELMRIQAEKFKDDKQLQDDWKIVQEYGDHEQFAKGFVEYVDTGKAPNSALGRAFKQFKQWLAELWDKISRSGDTAALSDEMRGVFDRILAGDSTFQTDYGMESVLDAASGGKYFQGAAQAVSSRTTKGGVEVRTPVRDTSNDTVMMDLLNSPNVVAQRHAKFRPFLKMGKDAEALQEKLRARGSRWADKIWGKPEFFGRKGGLVTEAQRETFANILIQGDLEGKVFSNDELRAMGAEDKTIQAYRLTRAMFNKQYHEINEQRKKYGKDEMGYREGYVPHIFHTFRVMKDGQILDTFHTMRETVTAAEGMNEKGLVVSPFMDDFGGQAQLDAVILGDTQYLKLLSNTQDVFALSVEDAREFLDGVARMGNRNRFFKNAIQRKGAAGWDTDMEYAFRHYMNYSARYIAMDDLKHKSRNLFERVHGKWGNDHSHNMLAKYTKDYINDVLGVPSSVENTLNNWIRNGKLGQFIPDWIGDRPAAMGANMLAGGIGVTKLGFLNFASAAINLTQLNGTQALIGYKWTGTGLAEYFRPSARTKALYREAGIEQNITMENPSGYSNAHNVRGKLADASMVLFRTADGMVRKATFLGAYRKAISEGQNHAAAMEYAKEINDRVNYDYSIADTPNFMRRTGPIGTLLFQFKKYPIKTMELFASMTPKQKISYAAHFIAMSGFLGLPAFDWLKRFIEWIWDYDIELEVKKLVSESPLPAAAKRTILYGIAANAGVDIGRRVGLADAFPSELKDLTGPAAATIARVVKSLPQISEGNFLDTIDAISPGLSNPLKALYGETKDQRGRTRFRYEGAKEKTERALGFRPVREAIESDAVRIANYETQKRSAEETAAIDAYIDARERYSPGDPEYKTAVGRLRKLRIKQSRVVAEMKKRRGGSAFERKMKEGKSQKARERREDMKDYSGMWR